MKITSQVLALLGLSSLFSCAAPDPAIGVANNQIPPATLTVALGEVQFSAPPDATATLKLNTNQSEARKLVLDTLRRANAAALIVDASDSKGVQNVDYVVSARVTEARFAYRETSERYWASGLLWLVTWIGGLASEDSTYDTKMKVEWSLQRPSPDSEPSKGQFKHLTNVNHVDTTFLERNRFLSWSTVQALVLPPFLTSDDTETTGAALTKRAIQNSTAEFSAFLKKDFETNALAQDRCKISITTPTCGRDEGSTKCTLSCEVESSASISAVEVKVNDGEFQPIPAAELDLRELSQTMMARIRGYELKNLKSGENFVRIRVVAGQVYSRTVRFHCGNAGQS